VSAKKNAGELLPAASVSTNDALTRPLAKVERSNWIDVDEALTILPVLTISLGLGAESSTTIL
jgi:hypothetical protein